MRIKKQTTAIFSAIVLLVSVSAGSISAAEPARVLVLPFNVHADKDLGYLKKGVADMLASRLTLKDKIVVVDHLDASLKTEEIPASIDADKALLLGAKSGSDYVLFGSLTVFGNSISTDASFFDTRQKQPLLTFSEVGQAQGEVISHINKLAGRIKEEVFGRKTPTPQTPVAQANPKPESTPSSRMHPEKLLDKEAATGIMVPEDRSSPADVIGTLWKTQTFKIEIKGIALGDVDGDTKNEAVFISSKNIFVYRYTNRRFVKIAEVQGPRPDAIAGIDIGVSPDNFIGVDVADINANGTAEIFVTSLSEENRLRSFVLEWNGTEFKIVTKDENWYYRAIRAKKGAPILLGQKGGYTEAFSGPVYVLGWDNVRYTPDDKQSLPNWVRVFGLTFGDVFNEGQDSVLAFRENSTLSILDKDGQEAWTSSDKYGGHNFYLLSPAEMKEKHKEGQIIDPTAMKGIYLQQRIFVTDLDRDKKNEVIVVKNHDVSRGIFHRTRKFTSGHFEALVWDNVGLRSVWKIRKFSGYISDYDVGDLDNDGTDELVFAVVASSDGVISDPRSYIVTWNTQK